MVARHRRRLGSAAVAALLALGGGFARAEDGPAVRGDFDRERPVGFRAEVLPTLGKLGCNAGACHGRASGQGGFGLSLFGADPDADLASIRRRLDPADPESSLFLLKPTGQVPHGGGSPLRIDSAEHASLLRWVARLADPAPPAVEPTLLRLEVRPARLALARGEAGRLRVVAHWSDGEAVDVTQLSRFEAGAGVPVAAGPDGEVRAGATVGEASVLARFGLAVAAARVVVPTERITAPSGSAAGSFVDRLVAAKLEELGLAPGPIATDAEFARRSALDVAGILPDPAEVAAFERDDRPGKRARWVDRLLDRPEYADHFATKWSAILRNRRALGDPSKPGTFRFHAWVREALAENLPFDRFAAAILAGVGDSRTAPAVEWYRHVATTEGRADDAAQVFLGVRIACARCHRHPTEAIGTADYAAFASFFARVGTKPGADPDSFRVFNLPAGLARDAKTGAETPPRPPGATSGLDLGPRDDPRGALVAWMTRPDGSELARAAANRYWKHFLGEGLVEPEDDFRATNPPSNPALLDALAVDFRAHGYDLKHLIRTIATSDAYARSSRPAGPDDVAVGPGTFATFAPRRLPAEVLIDAVDAVTGVAGRFEGVPAATRADALPDDGFASALLDAFGRPRRRTACECERSADPNLTQSLILLNSAEVEAKLADPAGRSARYAGPGDARPDAAKVEELYRVALARPPDPTELARALAFLAERRRTGQVRQGFEDLTWAVLNLREFLYNH